MQTNFMRLIIIASGDTLDPERAFRAEEILHGYVHGDICKLLTSRAFITDRQVHKQRIIVNAQFLLKQVNRL
jgi:hypothetical protein